MPQRIQRRRSKGWRMPPGALYVGRPSRWANPFKVGGMVSDRTPYAPTHPYDGPQPEGVYTVTGVDGEPSTYWVWRVRDRAEAVDLYRVWLRYHDDVFPLDRIRGELGGRDLACWCPLPAPGEPDICHAQVLLDLANPPAGPRGCGPKPFVQYRSWRRITDVTPIGGLL